MTPNGKYWLITLRKLALTFSLGVLLSGCGRLGGRSLTGKYLLYNHPEDIDAPDLIEFHPDGTCAIDAGDESGLQAKYHSYPFDRLTIEATAGDRKKYGYKYQLLKYTLILTSGEEDPLYYVRAPDGPHPEFSEITGLFGAHSDLGNSAGEITADRTFKIHVLSLVAEDRTYYDITMDGKCTYVDGIVTYYPEHNTESRPDKYVRDFIVKRDTKGIWLIDPFHDNLLLETPATNFDLPPPPNGYRNGNDPPSPPKQ